MKQLCIFIFFEQQDGSMGCMVDRCVSVKGWCSSLIPFSLAR